MSDCPIFAAASFMDRVWREVDHLKDAVADAISREDISAEYESEAAHLDDWADQRYAYKYALTRVFRHQRKPAQLLLYFDLARPGSGTAWSHGHSAVLVVAYDWSLEQGWDLEQLSFGTDGALLDPGTRRQVVPHALSGGRLLTWPGIEEGQWNRGAWAFGVELAELAGPDDLQKEIVRPLLALLRNEQDALEVLAGTGAIVWPEPMA